MDESELLESLKTDEERFNELTAGAEHFIRLKKQSGYEQPSPELEKTAIAMKAGPSFGQKAKEFGMGALAAVKGRAGEAANSVKGVVGRGPYGKDAVGRGASSGWLASGAVLPVAAYAAGKHMGKKDAEKTAGMATSAYHGAKSGLRTGLRGLKRDVQGMMNKNSPNYSRAWDAGHAASKIAPVVATGAIAHAVGKHQGEKAKEQEIFGDKFAEKRASMAEKLKSLGPLSLGLMGAGAATGGIGTYLASKPQADLGGRSRAEDELETKVKAQQGRPEKGLLHKMNNRTTELEHGYAKAFRDHPGKAALIGVAGGAAGGYGLSRLLDAVRSAR